MVVVVAVLLAGTTAVPIAIEFVVAVAAVDDIVVGAAEELVVTAEAVYGVIATQAGIKIFFVGADEGVVGIVTELHFFGLLSAAHVISHPFPRAHETHAAHPCPLGGISW